VTAAPSLRRLQEWMAFVVAHRSTADHAIDERSARARFAPAAVRAGKVVEPNDRMTPTERLQVYNGAYLARLVEVLAQDFGGVRDLVGEEPFHGLIADYVDRHPSRHQNLNRLGRHLPAFLRTRRDVPHRAFAVELADLELALCAAFDAPEFTPVAIEALQAVPPDRWDSVRLEVNPSLLLRRYAHAVPQWYQAWKVGGKRPSFAPQRSRVAVFRRDDRVFRSQLPEPAFAVLRALADGAPLAAALGRARGDERVGAWFREWAGDGLFTAVRTAD
jgi:hypothetical protein